MGITGDRYVGIYQSHSIELVRDNWVKKLNLLIDGKKVASASCILPHDITLTGTFEHNGELHTVVAKSMNRFPWTEDTIEVDGIALSLTKTK